MVKRGTNGVERRRHTLLGGNSTAVDYPGMLPKVNGGIRSERGRTTLAKGEREEEANIQRDVIEGSRHLRSGDGEVNSNDHVLGGSPWWKCRGGRAKPEQW